MTVLGDVIAISRGGRAIFGCIQYKVQPGDFLSRGVAPTIPFGDGGGRSVSANTSEPLIVDIVEEGLI